MGITPKARQMHVPPPFYLWARGDHDVLFLPKESS